MGEEGFDYELLGRCEYEVPGSPFPESCNEPAIAKGWWNDGIKSCLCKKHLDFIITHPGPEHPGRRRGENWIVYWRGPGWYASTQAAQAGSRIEYSFFDNDQESAPDTTAMGWGIPSWWESEWAGPDGEEDPSD